MNARKDLHPSAIRISFVYADVAVDVERAAGAGRGGSWRQEIEAAPRLLVHSQGWDSAGLREMTRRQIRSVARGMTASGDSEVLGGR